MAILLSLFVAEAYAGGGVISAQEALARSKSGELTIIDVRAPSEWRQTGVAEGARRATIHNRRGPAGFLEEIEAIVAKDKDEPIAMICARGMRSAAATVFLREKGFANVYDISEGMLGRGTEPGWIARQLPVEPCKGC